MALGKFGPVGTMNEGHMGHVGHVPAHGEVDQRLPRRVGEVINTANDVGHTHIVIINHN